MYNLALEEERKKPHPLKSPFYLLDLDKLSKRANIYAYDAYFLDCAIRHKAPLLTLDRKLMASAQNLNVETLEV